MITYTFKQIEMDKLNSNAELRKVISERLTADFNKVPTDFQTCVDAVHKVVNVVNIIWN